MKKVVLGIDTSCYTTSAALADENSQIVAFSRKLLPVQAGERGLRQSEAVFAHIKQLPQVLGNLFDQVTDYEICGVCVSSKPRDDDDSYMPVFTVGYSHAYAVASAEKVKLYTTSHQQGHIEAGLINNIRPADPFAALHLSGGTTELLYHDGDSLKVIGGSLDLHAGQLLDRVGVALGMKFPAGAELEKLAIKCDNAPNAVIPVSMEKDGLYCHMSGAEAQAMRLLNKGQLTQNQIALELFDYLSRTITRMIVSAAALYHVKDILIVGGVASSQLLREMIRKRMKKTRTNITVLFGENAYSSDNAAGVARIGMERYLRERGEET